MVGKASLPLFKGGKNLDLGKGGKRGDASLAAPTPTPAPSPAPAPGPAPVRSPVMGPEHAKVFFGAKITKPTSGGQSGDDKGNRGLLLGDGGPAGTGPEKHRSKEELAEAESQAILARNGLTEGENLTGEETIDAIANMPAQDFHRLLVLDSLTEEGALIPEALQPEETETEDPQAEREAFERRLAELRAQNADNPEALQQVDELETLFNRPDVQAAVTEDSSAFLELPPEVLQRFFVLSLSLSPRREER